MVIDLIPPEEVDAALGTSTQQALPLPPPPSVPPAPRSPLPLPSASPSPRGNIEIIPPQEIDSALGLSPTPTGDVSAFDVRFGRGGQTNIPVPPETMRRISQESPLESFAIGAGQKAADIGLGAKRLAVDAARELSDPETYQEAFTPAGAKQFGKSSAKAISSLPAQSLKSFSALAASLNAEAPKLFEGPTDEREMGFYRMGQGIQDWMNKNLPDDPELRENFLTTTLPNAVGSGLGFILQTALLRGAGAGPTASLAGTGFLAGAGAGREEARAAGVTDPRTLTKATFGEGALGLTEMAGVGSIARRVLGGETRGRVIKDLLAEAFEETVQETGQTIGSNVLAKKLYDADRDILTGAGEAGLAGAGAGSSLSLLASLIGGRRMRNRQFNSVEEVEGAIEETLAEATPEEQEVIAQVAETGQITPEQRTVLEAFEARLETSLPVVQRLQPVTPEGDQQAARQAAQRVQSRTVQQSARRQATQQPLEQPQTPQEGVSPQIQPRPRPEAETTPQGPTARVIPVGEQPVQQEPSPQSQQTPEQRAQLEERLRQRGATVIPPQQADVAGNATTEPAPAQPPLDEDFELTEQQRQDINDLALSEADEAVPPEQGLHVQVDKPGGTGVIAYRNAQGEVTASALLRPDPNRPGELEVQALGSRGGIGLRSVDRALKENNISNSEKVAPDIRAAQQRVEERRQRKQQPQPEAAQAEPTETSQQEAPDAETTPRETGTQGPAEGPQGREAQGVRPRDTEPGRERREPPTEEAPQAEEVAPKKPKAESRKAPPKPPDETLFGDPEDGGPSPGPETSIKVRDIRKLLLDLTGTPIDGPGKKSNEETLQEALDKGIPEQAMEMSRQILEFPRSLEDFEKVGFAVKLNDLQRRHQDELAKVNDDTLTPTEKDMAMGMADIIESDMETIARALLTQATHSGRSLNAQKAIIKLTESFDLNISIARAQRKKGSPLTSKERAAIKKQIEELQATVEAQKQRIEDLKNGEVGRAVKSYRKQGKRLDPKARKKKLGELAEKANKLLRDGCKRG